MINIALVEDEKIESENLKELVNSSMNKIGDRVNIFTFENGLQLLEQNINNFDLILLDIELPHMNGIDVAKKIRESNSQVLIAFVTNMAQYAIEGYEVNALSYILKPVNDFAITSLLTKALKIINKNNSNSRVIIESGDQIKSVSINDIYYIEILDHTCFIHTINEVIEQRKTLNYYEELLKEHGFIRSNSCYLINLKYVTVFDKKSVTINNEKLQISRSKTKIVEQSIKDYYKSII